MFVRESDARPPLVGPPFAPSALSTGSLVPALLFGNRGFGGLKLRGLIACVSHRLLTALGIHCWLGLGLHRERCCLLGLFSLGPGGGSAAC
jgi:hypothetical protein